MIEGFRERLAVLGCGMSGMLALIQSYLPYTLKDISTVVAIFAGVCGAILSLQQIYINYRNTR